MATKSQLQQTATINLKLTDPCDPPQMLTPPTLVNQIYTIGDSNQSYTFENFVVTSTPPDLCLVEYSYEI